MGLAPSDAGVSKTGRSRSGGERDRKPTKAGFCHSTPPSWCYRPAPRSASLEFLHPRHTAGHVRSRKSQATSVVPQVTFAAVPACGRLIFVRSRGGLISRRRKVGCEVGGAGVVGKEGGVGGDGVEVPAPAPAPAPVPSLGSGVAESVPQTAVPSLGEP
jgi:hypothetical protein